MFYRYLLWLPWTQKLKRGSLTAIIAYILYWLDTSLQPEHRISIMETNDNIPGNIDKDSASVTVHLAENIADEVATQKDQGIFWNFRKSKHPLCSSDL